MDLARAPLRTARVRRALGTRMGSSLRIGFEKKKFCFPPPDSSGEMPAEEATSFPWHCARGVPCELNKDWNANSYD